MKKKLITIVGVTALTLGMVTTALAARYGGNGYGNGYGNGLRSNGYNNDFRSTCYSLMRDQDGYFLDKEAFETNIDEAISNGLINEDDREDYIAMYDFCAANNGGFMGGCGRGGCYYIN